MQAKKQIAAVAAALALGLAAAAGAAGPDAGVGALTGTDPGAGTVSIDGREYRVTEGTRIEDETGLPLSLEQLDQRMRSGRDGLARLYRMLAVRFESAEAGGRPVLVRLAIARAPE